MLSSWFSVDTHTCVHLKHVDTNIIILWLNHGPNTVRIHTSFFCPCMSHPPESCTVRALSSLLSNNPLPREKQSVLDLKEKGPCRYHVQLSSRQNTLAQVWKEKCCHWGVVPFICRFYRIEIMG